MRLYIVRHGETDWNKAGKVQGHTDIPLNEYGRYLAEKTAEGMKETQIDLAFTSPLVRAKETAKIILGDRKVPLYEEERVKELCFGTCEGMKCRGENQDPGSEEFNKFFKDTEHYVPSEGAETIQQLYERTNDFLQELFSRKDLEDKQILISTHGAAMTALLNLVKGNLEIRNFWKDKVPKNCAVTIVDVLQGIPEITEREIIYY